MSTIASQIERFLQLCGEDPRAAIASRFDVLPVHRRLEGWTALRRDGTWVFIDDVTGRVSESVPDEWRDEALRQAATAYPDLELG